MPSTHKPGVYRIFWDFYGPAAQQTAAHFERHLRERLEGDSLGEGALGTGLEEQGPLWWAAWCDAPLEVAQRIGVALKAKRSQLQSSDL